ncbi:MAG: UDP-glucose 4-epimerase GalE [Cryomorphaceae bacterium]
MKIRGTFASQPTGMKIVVTGGAGYIGSHTIIDILERTNHEVVSIDNFSNSSEATFDRIEQITGKRVKNYNIDLTAYKTLKEEFFQKEKDLDGIIHFAALKAVGESVEKPVMYYQNNLNGLINLLKCVQKFDVQSFIFSSSCTVYGNAETQPVTEETPTQEPESPYGYTKLVGEKILSDFSKTKTAFHALSLRYFNPVGAHMSGQNGELPKGRPNNLVPVVTQAASGWIDDLYVHGNDYETRDGTAIRDYIHVSDIAHAHVLALEYLQSGKAMQNYDVFNLGSGNGVTVLEVIRAFEEVSGKKLNYIVGPRREGDVEIIYANNSKAKRVLGWEIKHGIEDAMHSAWEWQKQLNAIKSGDKVHP